MDYLNLFYATSFFCIMIFVLLIIVLSVIYYYLQRHYKYWSRKGVSGPSPTFLLGNIAPSIVGKKSVGDIATELYNEYKGHSFIGFYRTVTPCLLVRDIDLIRDITVKKFKYFQDNDVHIDRRSDRIFGRHPFCLKGNEWKTCRSLLTHSFTSGKMKVMFSMLEVNGRKMVNYINNNTVNETSTREAKRLCSMFTLENVNVCAFGMDSQCFQKTESTHMRMAYDIVKTGSLGVYKYFLSTVVPRVNKLIDVRIVNSSCGNELLHMLHTFMSYREESRIMRNDFLDSMVQIKRDTSSSEHDVLALGANFFIDGYETSSTVMATLLFELASHKDVQDKLRSEVRRTKKLSSEKLSYEQVQNMTYLDACFNENLRLHSVVSTLGKTCTKTYTYKPTKEMHPSTSVVIEKGTPVVIPISAIHHDPQYFENPTNFYPERFLDKRNIKKYTFMPFGEGPRSCLGKTFGALQIKVGVTDIINNFELSVNEKTKLPLKYNPWFFVVVPTGGLWIDFKKIEK